METMGDALDVIQVSGALNHALQIQRTRADAVKPMSPDKPRGIRRLDDRRLRGGIVSVLRSGAPWRDPPATYGPVDVLQSLGSVDDGLIALICPTCQMSISALDACRLLCMGLFSTF
jgi:hypothetical protein